MITLNTEYNSIEDVEKLIIENNIDKNSKLLIQVFTGILDIKFINQLIKDINKTLANSEIIGATTDGEIIDGIVSINKTIVSITKFENVTFNIDYIETWRKVVELQLQLLEIDNPEDFMFLYNEMQVLRRLMYPRVSKEGHLFMFTNALDNPQGGGFKWIKEQYTHKRML